MGDKKKKKVRKQEICQILSVKSIFSVLGFILYKIEYFCKQASTFLLQNSHHFVYFPWE